MNTAIRLNVNTKKVNKYIHIGHIVLLQEEKRHETSSEATYTELHNFLLKSKIIRFLHSFV